jgi:SAM-dependent methyltransferase
MSTPLPYEPRRFRTAAAHYVAGRPPYARRLIERVVERCRLGRADRLLDLGCGPGPLAIAFAPFVGRVVAIDPEPEMRRLAADAAAAAGVAIEIVAGSSYDLGPQFGRFRLVTIGRAFHWMDRVDTVRRLAEMVEPDGAVALFHDDHPKLPDNGWLGDFEAVIKRYAEDDPVRARRKSGDWVDQEAVLLDSPFPRLERIGVIERRRTPVENLVDRALSMSSTSPDRLGPRADDFLRDLRAALAGPNADGLVTEVVESTALLAWRPDATAGLHV